MVIGMALERGTRMGRGRLTLRFCADLANGGGDLRRDSPRVEYIF
jgi:hypothetical protein